MEEIILIGPVCSGKSTISKLIAAKLNMKLCSLDEIRFDYYDKYGYSHIKAQYLYKCKGIKGRYEYWKPFENRLVMEVLDNFKGYVFDFGGGHSVYEDDELLLKVQNKLESYLNIFLLLPCEDKERSLEILNSRKDFLLNEHFINHKSNYLLAKHIIYTEGKTLEEIRDEIIRKAV